MIVRVALLLLLWAACAPAPPETAEVRWELSCAHDSVAVGDAFTARLRASWPDSLGPLHLAWGVDPDSLLLVARDSSRVRAASGWEARRYDVTWIAPRAGMGRLPPAALVTATGETTATTRACTLSVGARLPQGRSADLRPLAPPLALQRFPWGWVAGAGLALAAGFVAALIWFRRRRRARRVPLPPPVPPEVEFAAALEGLLARQLRATGQMRAFAQELSWIVRRYLGRRWEQPALEATRPEILRWLPHTPLCVRDQGRIAAWLETTDRIKFAGEVPPATEAEGLLAEARAIVARCEEIVARRAAAEAAAADDERKAAPGGGA